MHDDAYIGGRSEIKMTISGERTEQLDIFSAASLALRVIFSVS